MTTNTPENTDACPENCPKCNAQYLDGDTFDFICGSIWDERLGKIVAQSLMCSALCRALEAKNKSEAELAEIKRDYHQPELCNERIMKLEAELAEAKRNPFGALSLIADIRAAVGDPTGKLMQDELVDHCKKLVKDNELLRSANSDVARIAAERNAAEKAIKK